MGIVKVVDLCKVYGEKEIRVNALDHVNLDIEQGQFVAIVGPSGSGKSTLLNMVGGLDVPSSGKVILDGTEIEQLDATQLTLIRRKKVGFIFQNYNLITGLSVEKNITLPIKLANERVDHALFTDIVESLGLQTMLKRLPNELSGGQQQRVAIARALIAKPALILADEPTGNLDTHTTEEVLKLLRQSCRKFNQTLLMITHNNSIAEIADRIIRIEDGKVRESA